MAAGSERAFHVHIDDGVPFLFHHVAQRAVAQDSRVVDQAVQGAEMVDRRVDHALGSREIGHVLMVGDGQPAGLDNLARHGLGGAFACVLA
ncbi:hypothetical protein D3C87_1777050 [compost metagenome]